MLIYLTGVMAGSLTVAVADPSVFLAGASGGVYALITAHLANVIFNWQEMEFPAVRLLGFILIAGVDTGVAVYYRSERRDYIAGFLYFMKTASILGFEDKNVYIDFCSDTLVRQCW